VTRAFELLDHVPLGIIVCGQDQLVRFWNLTMEDWTGIPALEIAGQSLAAFFPRLGEERYRTRLALVREGGPPAIFSYQINGCLFPHRDPRKLRRVQHATATHFRSDGGEVLVMITVEDRSEVSRRITSARAELASRIETEATLRTAVAEKEFLMRELNHRVKNNLNMILSLIQLQKETPGAETFRPALEDLENRIRSFAVLHQTMHRGGNPRAVQLDEYLGEIAQEVFDSLKNPQGEASLRVSVQPIVRPFRDALYLGLIISEAITNSMKYAVGRRVPTATGSAISVSLKEGSDGGFELTVSDDGPGFPPSLNPLEGESLGLKLIQLLVAEMGGTLAFRNGPGAELVVSLSSGSVST